jgi:hypothetical protein
MQQSATVSFEGPSGQVSENSLDDDSIGDNVIQYQMSKTIVTVHDLWREWKEGIGGQPPIELLEQKYNARWRKNRTDSRFFLRRKVILDEIVKQNKNGLALSQVLDLLENRRQMTNGKSLHALYKVLSSE